MQKSNKIIGYPGAYRGTRNTVTCIVIFFHYWESWIETNEMSMNGIKEIPAKYMFYEVVHASASAPSSLQKWSDQKYLESLALFWCWRSNNRSIIDDPRKNSIDLSRYLPEAWPCHRHTCRYKRATIETGLRTLMYTHVHGTLSAQVWHLLFKWCLSWFFIQLSHLCTDVLLILYIAIITIDICVPKYAFSLLCNRGWKVGRSPYGKSIACGLNVCHLSATQRLRLATICFVAPALNHHLRFHWPFYNSAEAFH